MSDYRPIFFEALKQKAASLGRRLTPQEIVEVCQGVTEGIVAQKLKERKRSSIHPDAERVYELFPKKVGRDAALAAISKALEKNSTEYLLDKTSQFARAVADWPSSYRYFQDGGDRCPHPSTWYNEARYADDPTTWKRHGARSAPPKVKVDMPEPEGWREAFPDFIHADKPWHSLDAFSQSHIIEHMKQRAHA